MLLGVSNGEATSYHSGEGCAWGARLVFDTVLMSQTKSGKQARDLIVEFWRVCLADNDTNKFRRRT
jgi:hypothetical protein